MLSQASLYGTISQLLYTMEVKTFMVYTLCIKVMKERVND